MIRTTGEALFLGLWRDPALLDALAHSQHLTTARYEPILHRGLGGGQIDLLFESGERSCVLGGIRLDPSNLVTRERSPFIWPAHLAALVDHLELAAIESAITPWLRALARARPMASESIRRFVPSERFTRARDADLLGAASLERTLPRLAPFVYARRFAANARVLLVCTDGALAQAVLGDVAAAVDSAHGESDDAAFARAWYATPASSPPGGIADVIIADQLGSHDAAVVVETSVTDDCGAAIVDVPSPAPWDVLFSFDVADAPAISRFGIRAVEPALRECVPLPPLAVAGQSFRSIALAVSSEALETRGGDLLEVDVLERRLCAEGFRVRVASNTADPAAVSADLIHIFGSPFEPHTVAFAELALRRRVDFVFDVAPKPAHPTAFLEENFSFVYRSSLDDADIARNMLAYAERRVDAPGPAQQDAADVARIEAQFAQLALSAAAIFAAEEDVDALRAALPLPVTHRIMSRGVFAGAEPVAARVGHIVPRTPFAFVHGPIGARSHCLFPAVAAERLQVPIVIAGPLCDVEYLHVLRATAPNAIVLADADAHVVSALYRRAAIWVDAAPRPRSSASLLRALACGALPVLAVESPLSRIAGAAPRFSLTSIDDCARVMLEALTSADRQARIIALRSGLLARRDPTSALQGVMAAYSAAPSSVQLAPPLRSGV